jgi:hypothetical protein
MGCSVHAVPFADRLPYLPISLPFLFHLFMTSRNSYSTGPVLRLELPPLRVSPGVCGFRYVISGLRVPGHPSRHTVKFYISFI